VHQESNYSNISKNTPGKTEDSNLQTITPKETAPDPISDNEQANTPVLNQDSNANLNNPEANQSMATANSPSQRTQPATRAFVWWNPLTWWKW